MSAYYSFIQREQHADGSTTAYYRSNIHAQGAWNPHEQHMAPATGILCVELEQFQPRADMRIGRVGLDIFGLIAFGEFSSHESIGEMSLGIIAITMQDTSRPQAGFSYSRDFFEGLVDTAIA